MERNGAKDAYECARRCLDAMADMDDLETRRSLWRAAGRYFKLAIERERAGAAGEPAPALTQPEIGLAGHAFERW